VSSLRPQGAAVSSPPSLFRWRCAFKGSVGLREYRFNKSSAFQTRLCYTTNWRPPLLKLFEDALPF
jgi:hypothetical protein